MPVDERTSVVDQQVARKDDDNRVKEAEEIQHQIRTPARGARGRSELGCNYHFTTRKCFYVADFFMFPHFFEGTQPKETKGHRGQGPRVILNPILTPARCGGGRSGLGFKYDPTTNKYLYEADFLGVFPLPR